MRESHSPNDYFEKRMLEMEVSHKLDSEAADEVIKSLAVQLINTHVLYFPKDEVIPGEELYLIIVRFRMYDYKESYSEALYEGMKDDYPEANEAEIQYRCREEAYNFLVGQMREHGYLFSDKGKMVKNDKK